MSNIISFNRNFINVEEKKLITSIQKYCFIYGIKKDLTGFSEFYLTLKNLLSVKTDEYQNILLLTNKTRELYDQSRELEKKLTKGRS